MMRAIALLVLSSLCVIDAVNNRPVIGILDQPKSGMPGKTVIAASYVKYVESAGARVVPIHYKQTVQELKQIARSVNGILFPGGSTGLVPGDPFYTAVQTLYNEVVALHKEGVDVPLWGTCMGFQILSVLQADDTSVLESGFDSWNYPIPLNFTSLAAGSRMLAGAPASLLSLLATQPLTMNNHHFGVRPAVWSSTPALADHFTVLSTNRDLQGKQFVSMFEDKKRPIFGAQWHPEKNAYEWVKEDIPHSEDAVIVGQFFANFLVRMARQNNQAFKGREQELQKHLIYNYQTTYTGRDADASYEQIYVFPQ